VPVWMLGPRAAGAMASMAGAGGIPGAFEAEGSPAAAAQELRTGFEAQAAGRPAEALRAYRAVQRMRSPALRCLAANAEGLLLLRAPLVFAPHVQPVSGGTAVIAGSCSHSSSSGICSSSGSSRSDRDMLPAVPCTPGQAILAPWAEDGAEYGAALVSMDVTAGECVVNWADGGTTHRVVPLAGVSTLEGGICVSAVEDRPDEVRAWVVRRALRRALDAWELQAEFGTTHDAFVDLIGVLCDVAAAEVRVALASPERRWLAEGLGHARRHLQRARWVAERAYAPDPRALAVLCMHRAELLRLTSSAAAAMSGPSVASTGGREGLEASFSEVLELHERAAEHLAAARFRARLQASQAGGAAAWQRPGGSMAPEVVHGILWAKALASQAALPGSRARVRPRALRRPPGLPALAHGRVVAACPRGGRQRRARSRAGSQAAWSPPEKLLAPASGRLATQDPLLLEACLARVAIARAWCALHAFVGEPVNTGESLGGILGSVNAVHAVYLAAAATKVKGSGESLGARLLLEVASLTFAMGCRIGRPRWARAAARPLAEAAARGLAGAEAPADDAHTAAALVGAVLRGGSASWRACQASRLGVTRAEVMAEPSEPGKLPEQKSGSTPRWRWRLAGYRAMEELWLLRCGPRQVASLPAAPPLTWCVEGLALSETAPSPLTSFGMP